MNWIIPIYLLNQGLNTLKNLWIVRMAYEEVILGVIVLALTPGVCY